MKYLLLLAALFVFAANATSAQAKAKLLPGEFVMYPYVSKKPVKVTDSFQVTIEFSKDYKNLKSGKVELSLYNPDLPNNLAITGTFTGAPTAQVTADKVSVTGWVKITADNMPDSVGKDMIAIMYISDDGSDAANKVAGAGFFNIRLTDNNDFFEDNPFWIEAGANFDLVDKVKPNNLFAGVFFYKRDIRPLLYRSRRHKERMQIMHDKAVAQAENDKADLKKSASDKLAAAKWQRRYDRASRRMSNPNLAIAAGVYESKAISTNSSNDFSIQHYYDATSFSAHAPDSITLYTDTGSVTHHLEIHSIGLFFSPQVRLTAGSANEDGVHFFASAYAEMLWQNAHVTNDYSGLRHVDTSIRRSINSVDSFHSLPVDNRQDFFSHYEGVGGSTYARFHIRNEAMNLYINAVFGMSNQPKTNIQSRGADNLFTISDRDWRPFYLVQFRLSEDFLGATFSGEVRGLLAKNSPPFVTLVVSKKFGLRKLFGYQAND